MFTGYFDNQATFVGEGTSRYEADGLQVAFWGVLYNREVLSADAIRNDAEAVALSYRRGGVDSFGQLDGSFTFVLWTQGRTLLVRDHHGTNHQVYYNDTCFSSSLLQLRAMPGAATEVDHGALSLFLSVGYIPTGRSAFRGVKKLAAGHALIYDDGRLRTVNLFDTSTIEPTRDEGLELETLSRQYGELHARAIRRRIGESRNVGILLSGGYDSGCNLAALRQNYDGDIRSYSIGFKGDNWTELPLARCMSETFGTIHREYEIDGSEVLALPDLVRELGDPFVEGGLMVNYTAMRMIGNDKPDVILGGDGSDQYFGTSGREVAIRYLMGRCGAVPLLKLLAGTLGRELFDKNSKPYRLRFYLDKILHLLQGDLFGFEEYRLRELLQERDWVTVPECLKADVRSFEHLYTQHAYHTDLEKIIDQVILFKATRMADMFGNKIAFPYMDLELYDFLKQLPVRYKCRGDSALQVARGYGTAKFLLKYHYKPLLPEAITCRKKQGGFAPMPIFFKDRVQRARLADFILQSSVVREFLKRDAVERFIATYDRECDQTGNWFWYKQNKAIQYFNLLTLSLWWEQYVAGKTNVRL